jgi:hypothetical protein
MAKITTGNLDFGSDDEKAVRRRFVELFKSSPIPDHSIIANLGLFLNSKVLSRLLFLDHIYREAIDVQGVIMDFGARWGQNMSVFAALRGIYEPFNRHKKIIGFDTFSGFPSISAKDGNSQIMEVGSVSVTDNYLEFLDEVMTCQERDNPLGHLKKFEFAVGDATKMIHEYLEQYPETIVALAFFDFDLYEPTKACLEAIKPRLVKGSVLGFDELNDHDSPGETAAVMEVFGLNNIRLKRHRYASRVSYFVVE